MPYIVELNNLGLKERKISSSILKLHRYIHSYIQQHNLSYEPSKIKGYQTVQKGLQKNGQYSFEALNTKINIEKLTSI